MRGLEINYMKWGHIYERTCPDGYLIKNLGIFSLLYVYNGAICRLRPLDAVLSSGLCGKGGALPPVTG